MQNYSRNLKMKQPSLIESSLQLKTNTVSHLPIFILGMPRSGTSLVEQIISSHSEVTGGELNHVAQLGGILAISPTSVKTASISKFRENISLKYPRYQMGSDLLQIKCRLIFVLFH